MQAASVLLKNKEYSIGDIINVLEFEAENYFYYMFKKYYGKSPLQYRKSIN
jgi:YesN/AraC family two-component response regulator